jgi:uncharacterized membrane protein YhiD involved in acid resistance
MSQTTRMNRQAVLFVAVIVGIFMVSALAAYFLLRRDPGEADRVANTPPAPTASVSPKIDGTPAPSQQPPTARSDDESFFAQVFGLDKTESTPAPAESWSVTLLKVVVRLTLAALLTAILAFRPRKFSVLFKRNLFVAQTQILLAVVASALMMIVGDSAARAFGIFAAVSLVRFRTNIKDPKEITVLLVSLAVGLGTGVGRWELAGALSLFVLALLWVLEYREQELVFRSLELRVRTRNLGETHELIKEVFQKHDFGTEIRSLNREDEKDHIASIVLCVDVSPSISTDALCEEILDADNNNIESIEWNQQKSSANIYQ